MAKENKTTAVPKLRFPQFSDRWQVKPLEALVSPVVREKEKPTEPYTGLGVRSHGRGTFLKPFEAPEKNSMERLYEVQKHDLILNITFAWEGAIAVAQECDSGALVSHRFPTYAFNTKAALPDFLKYSILDKQFIYQLGVISPGGAGRNRVLNKRDFLKLTRIVPTITEQQKIADCLTSLDEVIAAQGRKTEALKTHKRGLMQQLFPHEGEVLPRLRFPEFSAGLEWREWKVGDLITTVTPPKKLPTSSYRRSGAYAIVDQSPNQFCGWTDDEDALVVVDQPVVIFGDHTCTVKLIRESFAQGADGIKILDPKPSVSSEFLFQALQLRPLAPNEYKRHFSDLREKLIRVPPRETGEQERVSAILATVDTQIDAETRKFDALKIHKAGLVQQLFPSMQEAL
jgi:type I restriction enzyme S subunit